MSTNLGAFRHHGNRIVGPVRTRDSASALDPLSGLTKEQTERDARTDTANPTGHRESFDGATNCGCAACTKRRTQDAPVRSLRDINRKNRERYGR